MDRLIKYQSSALGLMYSRVFAGVLVVLVIAAFATSHYEATVAADVIGAILLGFLLGTAIVTRFWTRRFRG